MNTPVATTFEGALSRPTTGRFFFYMTAACALVAFAGFLPTYWWPLLNGKLSMPPVMHVHAVVFFSWSLFLVWQAWLAGSGQLRRHRAIGMLGISLATTMTILGYLTAIRQMQTASALGQASAGEAFAIVPLAGITFFAISFALAIVYVSRPDWHKRLVLLAAISILDAPVARWFITLLAPAGPPGPPPVEVAVVPALVAYLLIVVAIVHDWRTRGRPHPVYLAGGGALVALKLVQVPISTTPAWHAVARAIHALAS